MSWRKRVVPLAVEYVSLGRQCPDLGLHDAAARFVPIQPGADGHPPFVVTSPIRVAINSRLTSGRPRQFRVICESTSFARSCSTCSFRAGNGRPRCAAPTRRPALVRVHLPIPAATTVGAAPVRCHQQSAGPRIGCLSHAPPPAPQRLAHHLGCVVVHHHVHPACIRRQVVNPVRNRLAQLLIRGIMHLHLLRISLQPPLPASVPVRSH